MKKASVASVFAFLVASAPAAADPIQEIRFNLEAGQAPGSPSADVSGSLAYDSSAVPSCDSSGFFEFELFYEVFECSVDDFVSEITVSVDGTEVSANPNTSRYQYHVVRFLGDEEATDWVFGAFAATNENDFEGAVGTIWVNANFIFAMMNNSSAFNNDVVNMTIFGAPVSGVVTGLAITPVFDTVRIDGRLVSRVPEPGTFALFALGLIGLGIAKRRRRLFVDRCS